VVIRVLGREPKGGLRRVGGLGLKLGAAGIAEFVPLFRVSLVVEKKLKKTEGCLRNMLNPQTE
jgi:hypothetical protein